METTEVSINRQMGKNAVYIYIYDGIFFHHEKEGNPAIGNNMDGP